MARPLWDGECLLHLLARLGTTGKGWTHWTGRHPGEGIEQARLMREIDYIVGFLVSREEPVDVAHPYVYNSSISIYLQYFVWGRPVASRNQDDKKKHSGILQSPPSTRPIN